MATLLVASAVAGHCWSQTPGRLPEPNIEIDAAPVIAPKDGAGRATISSEPISGDQPVEQTPEKKIETVPPPKPANSTQTNGTYQPNSQAKPSLMDLHQGPPEQLWLRASYLYWRMSDMPIPQVLASVNGQTAIGAEEIDFGNFNGVRIEGGWRFGCQHLYGIEFGGYWLQERSRTATVSGDGSLASPIVARPIIDALPNQPFDVLVAAPGGLVGDFTATASTQLGSWEINLVRNVCFDCGFSFDAFIGARYIDLEDQLLMVQNSTATFGTPFVLNNSDPIYNHLNVSDRFYTRNQLWAGQVGGRFEYRSGIWFGAVTGKVALGPNHQTTVVDGQTLASGPNVPTAVGAGGLLALPGGEQVGVDPNGQPILQQYANGGTRRTDWFTVAPEVGVQVGAQLTRTLRGHIGYNFLYINNVVRPGDLINTTINRKYVPFSESYRSNTGPDQPAARFSRDDFIAHGVEVGLQFQF